MQIRRRRQGAARTLAVAFAVLALVGPSPAGEAAEKLPPKAWPMFVGDRVYYVTPACIVVCADVATGKAVWQLDMMTDLKVFPCYLSNCAPLVVGDLVYVVTGNGLDDSQQPPKLVSPKAPSFLA